MEHRALELAMPGIEDSLGRPTEYNLSWPGVSVTERGPEKSEPFIAIRTGMAVNISCRSEWVDSIRSLAVEIHPDLLFSPLGCYDLNRITLSVPAQNAPEQGTGIWGPIPSYVADRSMWRPFYDERPELLSKAQFTDVDFGTFWHCASTGVIAAFGVYEEDALQALATVKDHGNDIWEIGVDVLPAARGNRLGSAVVGAAGDWVLENDHLVYATAAAWNVPSSRNLRTLGMQYACNGMVGLPAPFQQPPQPLGTPLPGARTVNWYPNWAMNGAIEDKIDS